MIKQICKICKKEFLTLFSEIKRGGGKYCSRKCFYSSNQGQGNPLYGKKPSLKTRQKMRIAKLGKKLSPEHSKKISLNSPHYWRGKKFSIEHRNKLSKIHKGKTLSEKHKRKIGLAQKGSKHWNWGGGRKIDSYGYILIHSPNHPNHDKYNYVRRSHLVAESILKRYLKPPEIIHHIDNNVKNDKPENLYLFKNNILHLNYHRRLRLHPETKITKSNLTSQ